MGIRGGMARNTLANANRKRDWRIHPDFAQALIRIARPLYAEEDLGLELDNTVYALDSSTVDRCLSVFPWALFRSTKSGVKLHTLLDLRGNIPAFIHVSEAKLHDVNILDLLVPEPGAFYVMDRAYVDFKRLFSLHRLGAFFVVRAKSNIKFRRRYSAAADKSTGVRCDQTIVLTGAKTRKRYPQPLRRVGYYDAQSDRRFNFLTNHFAVPATTVAELYRHRWQVELFFKWIKQHLRIKSFFGASEKCGENPTLERSLSVCAGGHREKAAQHLRRPLHNSADTEPHPVQKNPIESSTCKNRIHPRKSTLN